MSAAKLTLPAIEQGATYRHVLYWKEPDQTTPINITGCSAKMQVRSAITSAIVIIELSTTNGRITITGPEGKIELYIADEDTTLLEPIIGALYDLEIYHPNGETTRLIQGKISISAEVTRG